VSVDTASAAFVRTQNDVLDRVVHASLRPALLFIAPLLFGLGLFHWVLLPAGVAGTMTAIAEVSTLACVLLLVHLRRGRVPIAWAHRTAGGLAALVLGNSLAHLYLVRDPADTTNVLLFMAGAGFVLLSTRWLVTCLVVAWAGWIALALAQPDPSGWWRFTFALISATVLSAVVHSVRLRTVVRLEALRLELEARVRARTIELSAANERLVATNATLQSEIGERRAAEGLLASERNLLRTLLDHLPEAVYVKDVDGCYQIVNPAWLQMHGLDRADQLIGRRSDALADAAFGRRQDDEDGHLLRGGDPIVNHEETYNGPDGDPRHLLTSKSVVLDPSGAIVGLVAVCRDVTVAKRQEQMREQMDRKLRDTQKLESLGVLAGGIAHDFNNLLTGILGNVSLARMERLDSTRRETYLAQIEAASVRAADLCRQMLAYAGRGQFAVRAIDVNAIVDDTLPLLQVSISKKASVKLNLAERVPAVSGDLTQLRQVLMNLVINASDAIGEATGTIVISTGAAHVTPEYLARTVSSPDVEEGDYTFIEVSDDGLGMTRETMARIFEPFFTTKFTGRGLGLSVVLGIVRGHRGALTVYSEPGRGSSFKMLLPAVAGPPDAFEPWPRVDIAWKGAGEILVIDDEEPVRNVAAAMLGQLGFTVSVTTDGAEGLALFRTFPERFAAVLLDLTMPSLSGDETFRELRATRPDIRVLLMSGFNEQDAVAKFVGRGLTGFLQKPFTLEMLRAQMQAMFRPLDEPEP
jgi:PAS domain S-box-containing protein